MVVQLCTQLPKKRGKSFSVLLLKPKRKESQKGEDTNGAVFTEQIVLDFSEGGRGQQVHRPDEMREQNATHTQLRGGGEQALHNSRDRYPVEETTAVEGHKDC